MPEVDPFGCAHVAPGKCPIIAGVSAVENIGCSGFVRADTAPCCAAWCAKNPDTCSSLKTALCSGVKGATLAECACAAGTNSSVRIPDALNMTEKEFRTFVDESFPDNTLAKENSLCWWPACQDSLALLTTAQTDARAACPSIGSQCLEDIREYSKAPTSANLIAARNSCYFGKSKPLLPIQPFTQTSAFKVIVGVSVFIVVVLIISLVVVLVIHRKDSRITKVATTD